MKFWLIREYTMLRTGDMMSYSVNELGNWLSQWKNNEIGAPTQKIKS
jgi:hypothetical protein